MSEKRASRPEVRWPLYVTIWCFIAAVYATRTGGIFIPILAVCQTVAVWGIYATSKPVKAAR